MAHLAFTCPHCETQKSSFSSSWARTYRRGDVLFGELFMTCASCLRGVIVQFVPTFPRAEVGQLEEIAGDPALRNWHTIAVWPERSEPTAPEHVAGVIASAFLQAASNLKRQNWEASGAMSRRALDLATRELAPSKGVAGHNLYPRIKALGERGKLTPDLVAWALTIKDLGDDATHDPEPFTQESATELFELLELFLTYTFTMPGRMAKRLKKFGRALPPSTDSA